MKTRILDMGHRFNACLDFRTLSGTGHLPSSFNKLRSFGLFQSSMITILYKDLVLPGALQLVINPFCFLVL
jgi:hypothetical protein